METDQGEKQPGTTEKLPDSEDNKPVELLASRSVAAVLSLCIQHFIGGLITTLVFSKMMLCSQKAPGRIQATHYSFLAAIEVLGKVAFSTVAGSLVDWLGFQHTFGIFLALSFASVLYTM